MTDTEMPAPEAGAGVVPEVPAAGRVAPETGAGPATEAGPPENESPQAGPDEERPKRPEYEIVAPKREMPETGFVVDPIRALVEAELKRRSEGAPKQKKQRLPEVPPDGAQKSAKSQTKWYAVIGIGLGVVVGLTTAVLLLHPASQSAGNDMGPADANAYGLKGHLTTNWNGRLDYQVTIEPAEAKQEAAFRAAVSRSAKPLSVEVQAKDPFGAVLCSDTVLVRFDPRNAPGMAVAEPGPKATAAEKTLAERNQIARGIALAKLEGQELDREHGKTIFQNDTGKDGQVASIGAQGVLPCTRQQYEKVASWGFASNFPIVTPAAQGATDTNAQDAAASESSAKDMAAQKAAVNSKAKRKAAPALQPIYIEGDDSIVWIDAASGAMETQGGKVLVADKSDGIAATLKGRDFPIRIHYRCDQEGSCTFGGVGTGLHHARLRR